MAVGPYRAPPPPPTTRRVYQLPVDLVKGIHAYGHAEGHQSEVSAVRALLEEALKINARKGKPE